MSYNIPSTTWQLSSGVTGSPLTIGTNLILSAAGLSAPRTFTLPNISDQIDTQTSTNSLTNKTFDAKLNTLLGIWQSPIYGRYGDAQPGNGTTGALSLPFSGALAGAAGYYSTNITFANAYDTSEGLIATQVTTAVSGQGTGILSNTGASGICRSLFSGRLRTRFKVSTVASGNFYFGLTSNTVQPLTTTPLGNSDSGVIIGWRNTDTNYQIFNNNGGGAETVTQVAGPIATDTNWHTLEINWPAGGASFNCIVDGTTTNISTALPATSTPLFFNQTSATSTTSAVTQSIHATTVEFAK